MKSTSDKKIFTVVNGIKKDDSSKEVSPQTFEKTSVSKHSTNSINEIQTQNQDTKNNYIIKNVSIHGKVTYEIDNIALVDEICEEYKLINNSVMTAVY
ncbi:hypothetical protein, partial [Bacillus thuringiensis]